MIHLLILQNLESYLEEIIYLFIKKQETNSDKETTHLKMKIQSDF